VTDPGEPQLIRHPGWRASRAARASISAAGPG
jgi:hypothetical protein